MQLFNVENLAYCQNLRPPKIFARRNFGQQGNKPLKFFSQVINDPIPKIVLTSNNRANS